MQTMIERIETVIDPGIRMFPVSNGMREQLVDGVAAPTVEVRIKFATDEGDPVELAEILREVAQRYRDELRTGQVRLERRLRRDNNAMILLLSRVAAQLDAESDLAQQVVAARDAMQRNELDNPPPEE